LKIILVFGCEKKFVGETKRRCEKALIRYLKRKDDGMILIFSGVGAAVSMAHQALKHKDIKNIIIENISETTKENVCQGLPRFYFCKK